MVHIEDDVVTLSKWWRKTAAVTVAGLVLATVLLADGGTILTFKGAVPYETLTMICAALLLTLVIIPCAASALSFLPRVLEARVLAVPRRVGFVMDLQLMGAVDGCARSADVSVVERPALAKKTH